MYIYELYYKKVRSSLSSIKLKCLSVPEMPENKTTIDGQNHVVQVWQYFEDKEKAEQERDFIEASLAR